MIVISNKMYTPSEFVELITGEYYIFSGDNDSVSIRRVLDKHGYEDIWDYMLSEIDHICENQYQVVLVDCMNYNPHDHQFYHSYRWFQVPEDKIEKFKNQKEVKDVRIFSDFDVYSRKYTYDEMKVMAILSSLEKGDNSSLDYEDLMRIVEAVYAHWIDGRDSSENEKYKQYPWLEFANREEDGYIQAYAERTLPEFIKMYKETKI